MQVIGRIFKYKGEKWKVLRFSDNDHYWVMRFRMIGRYRWWFEPEIRMHRDQIKRQIKRSKK